MHSVQSRNSKVKALHGVCTKQKQNDENTTTPKQKLHCHLGLVWNYNAHATYSYDHITSTDTWHDMTWHGMIDMTGHAMKLY